MKPITTAELLKLVSDTHSYDGSFAPQVRRAVAEVFRLRRKLSVMQASKPVQMNGGQTFTIKLAEGVGPDKVAAIFEKLAEHRVEAKTTITPDFEFPGPWIRFEMSEEKMKSEIALKSTMVYLDESEGIERGDADLEVVSNDTKDPKSEACCVRALTREGQEWIQARTTIPFEETNPAGVQGGPGRPASDTLDEERR